MNDPNMTHAISILLKVRYLIALQLGLLSRGSGVRVPARLPFPHTALREIRYGIIGTGMMGVEHIRSIAAIDRARVTAIAEPAEESRAQALEEFDAGKVVAFESTAELIDSGACDAVVVTTPNDTHVDVLLELMRTELHVLAEKPLCTTVKDCDRVIAAAEGRRAVTWVGLEYRYMPPVARLIEEVRGGRLGQPRMVSIREHRFPFLEKVDNWNRFSRRTGGTLVEKCCHYFDLMNHIIGARPVRVFASGSQDVNHLDESYGGERSDILDNAFVTVDYDNGARALLDLCMFAEGGRNQEEVTVVGDRGKVESHLPSSEVAVGLRSGEMFGPRIETVRRDDVRYAGFHHGASYLEHLDFLDAIRSGTEAKVSLADGRAATALGVAAHRSIDEGRAVEV